MLVAECQLVCWSQSLLQMILRAPLVRYGSILPKGFGKYVKINVRNESVLLSEVAVIQFKRFIKPCIKFRRIFSIGVVFKELCDEY